MPEHAAEWLSENWPYGETLAPELVHRGLALAQVCRAIDPATSATTDAVVANALERELDFVAPDLMTALLSAALAIGAGVESAVAYRAILGEVVNAGPVRDERAVAVRLALEGAVAGEVRVSLAELGPRWFRASARDDRDRALATVETRTSFGTRRALAEDPLALLLEGAALHAARRYDLPGVLRCLRACAYLGAQTGLGCQAAARFVRLSRREDGAFGHYETSISNLRHDRRANPTSVLALRLAVTMQALWTFAELEDPQWRLLATLATVEAAC
jgi:hypothetical protein